jgi:tRNA (guanine-N(7)-)-methyltransferase subunit TRM82
MAFPFQCLSPLGRDGVLCAAKGSSIFTFGADGALLSSWHHPAAQSKTDTNTDPAGEEKQEAEVPQEQADESSPPSKRRKIGSDTVVDAAAEEPTGETAAPLDEKANGGNQKKSKKEKSNRPDRPLLEHPFVILLKATPDGSHVIAVTGQDKSIWVFEHDGSGQLKELSRR